MKALAYAALLLAGTLLVAVSAQVMVVSSQTAVDADDNELSPSTAAVLATTRDSLSPADQNMLQEMLQESEGVTLVDENGDSLEGEIEAEADSLAEAAEEAEDEAEEEADHSVVAEEIPGTAHAVHSAEEDELDEAGETVEAEDLDAADEDADEGGDVVEEAEAEADAALADSEDAALLQIDESDDSEDEDQAEEEDEAEDESEDEEEAEDEGEDEEEAEDEDEADEETEAEAEDESEEEEEETELVETSAAAVEDEHILSVPEAEAHHMLLSVQEPALAFLQVAEELEESDEADTAEAEDAEAEVSDSAEQFESAEDAEAQVSDSADNGSEMDEGWGEEFSDTDPYSLLQVAEGAEAEAENENESEELLYADTGSEEQTLLDAPLNAVTSTSQTAAQIHAELDEAANAATSTEFQVDAAAAAAAPAHSDAAEAEADSDTSEEMEVNELGEGVWEDIKSDMIAAANPPKYRTA